MSGNPVLATTASALSPVGSYTISVSQGSLTATNYDFPTLIAGAMSRHPGTLTVTADPKSKRYGDPVPSLSYTITGFVNGEGMSVVTRAPALSSTVSAASYVGSYNILIAAGTLAAANYDFPHLVDGSLVVTRASLTIKADDAIREIDQPNPSLTIAYSGFVNGDTASSLTTAPTLSTIAGAGSPAGTYPIIVGARPLAQLRNHLPGRHADRGSAAAGHDHERQPGSQQASPGDSDHRHVQRPSERGRCARASQLPPGNRGHHRSFTARNAKIIKLRAATFIAANDTVVLTAKNGFSLSKPVQLQINSQGPAGLRDIYGRLIDGGQNFVAVLGKTGPVTTAAARGRVDLTRIIDPSSAAGVLAADERALSRWPRAPVT